jgi:hypothetical protein
MTVTLPDPTQTIDVWGEQLNAYISNLNTQVTTLQGQVAALQAVISNPGSDSGFVPLSAVGADSGVASLDSGGRIPKPQLQNLSYADVGAAAAQHTHALADVPDAAKGINNSLAVGIYNVSTSLWPSRVSITSSPTRSVMWFGNATVPADAIPGVDLFFGPKVSGTTTIGGSTTPPPPTSGDANGVTLPVPTVTVSGGTYTLKATPAFANAKTFTYLQFAVRGPNGENQDTGYNNGYVATAGSTLAMTGSGTATSNGTWTARVSYSLDGTTWVDGTTASFTVTLASNGGTGVNGTMPLVGLSGLAWNSGLTDSSDGGITSAQAFGTWRGRPVDTINYFTGRSTQADLHFLPDSLTSFAGYREISVSSQPDNAGGNSVAAAGGLNADWTTYGQQLVAKGWNDGKTVIRLNWEANLNSWPHSWANGGAANYVNAFKNVVTSIRAGGATNVKFNMCMNRGNVVSGIDWRTNVMNSLIGYVDIVGLDWYDFAPSQVTDSTFNAARDQDPGFTTIASYCRSNGLKMSVDEWGAADSVSGYTGGGDSAYWIQKMHDTFAANTDVFVNDVYFNLNADGLNQQLYPVDTKPLSSAQYKSSGAFGK